MKTTKQVSNAVSFATSESMIWMKMGTHGLEYNSTMLLETQMAKATRDYIIDGECLAQMVTTSELSIRFVIIDGFGVTG